MNILGIDIGGTGIKGAIVDSLTGDIISERLRIPTPQPATPENVSLSLKSLIKEFQWEGPVGISFPTIIKNGKAMHFGNLDPSWQFTQVDTHFKSTTGNDYFIVNDADAAAIDMLRPQLVYSHSKLQAKKMQMPLLRVVVPMSTSLRFEKYGSTNRAGQ